MSEPPDELRRSQADHEEPSASDVEELRLAMEEYRRVSGRMFPTWCEVLEVLRWLGYRKPGESENHEEDPQV